MVVPLFVKEVAHVSEPFKIAVPPRLFINWFIETVPLIDVVPLFVMLLESVAPFCIVRFADALLVMLPAPASVIPEPMFKTLLFTNAPSRVNNVVPDIAPPVARVTVEPVFIFILGKPLITDPSEKFVVGVVLPNSMLPVPAPVRLLVRDELLPSKDMMPVFVNVPKLD